MSWSWSFQVPVPPAGVDWLVLLGNTLVGFVALVVMLIKVYRGPRNAMRYFRRLPPLVRVASLLRLLLPLVFIVLPLIGFVHMMSLSRTASLYADWLIVIVLNLGMVGAACVLVVRSYTERFREPGALGPFPLDSWQSQVRALLLTAGLPICALLLAVVISPTSRAFEIVFQVSGLGIFVLVVAGFNVTRRWDTLF